MDNVKEYFDRLMGDRRMVSVEDCLVHTREDAMMIAASIIYSGTEGFPYEVEFGEGMVQTDAAAIRQVRIRRRGS